jgi:hypothetical protein
MYSKKCDSCKFDRQFDECGLLVDKKTPEGETEALLRFRFEKLNSEVFENFCYNLFACNVA